MTSNIEKIKESIYKFSLQNALLYNGKANKGSVIGKVIAEHPEIKQNLKEIMPFVDEIINKVNSMKLDEIEKEAEKFEDLFSEKKKDRTLRDLFRPLEIDENKPVVTAFPPGPEKYPHIGHAKAALLNYLLAKEYNGTFILRFEDTNPELVKEEFYKIFEEDLSWLGIKWDKLIYASDYLEVLYNFAEQLIKENKAYMCTCDVETMRKNRQEGIECSCRTRTVDENLKLWKEMFTSKENEMVLRLKIDMKHQNTTMRDPTIFRVIEHPHPRKNARVWPTYDFQNAVLDGYTGVTHRLRTKEFELRSELHSYIRKILNLPDTKTYEFARFSIRGVETSGRKIREAIQKGELTGWDDPSLVTLRALKRRGILPEAIKELVINTGINKSESELDMEDLFILNRKLLDDKAYRFFAIFNPVKIKIIGAPKRIIKLKLHPSKDYGYRELNCDEFYYLEKSDYDKLENGKMYRLMDNLNFIFKDGNFIYDSDDYLEYKNKGSGIFHWLPVNDELIKIKILMPNHEILEGFAEKTLRILKQDQICQFERFGFARLDNEKENFFYFTHK
ncbi:MAG: glutamate--tRNA ligase [Candidatus Woesearchaeota archaeon]